MIQFNELRIIDDKLIIDISVKDLSYYELVTIGEIQIDNQDKFSLGGPSNTFSVPSNKISFYREGKAAHCELTQEDLPNYYSLNKDLFFVYAIASENSIPAANTPCGMDNCYSSGAVTNLKRLYNKGISYIKELANSCEIPLGFADFILKYKAFVLSLRACDFLQAIKFWKKFFNEDNKVITRGCGCHGGYSN